jgi:hypothetical protein
MGDFGVNSNTQFEFNQTGEGATRVGNLPLPPLVKALLSAAGVDIRAGLAFEDGDVSLIQKRTLPTADRMTPNLDQARFQGGELSTRLTAIIQDLGGALATIGLKSFEAFFSGTESTPVSERAVAAIDQLGLSVLSSSRYANFLFAGRGLSVSQNASIGKQVFSKKEALTTLLKANKINTEGVQNQQGTTQDYQQDPVYMAAAADAANVIRQVQPQQEQITDYTRRINSLQNSLVNNRNDVEGIPRGKITIAQRSDLINAYKSQINILNTTILGIYKDAEEHFANVTGARIDKDLSGFTYDGISPRANPN